MGVGFLVGILAGYTLSLQQNIALREQVEALRKPPKKIMPDEKWEKQKPNTTDEYKLTSAKADWFRGIFAKYIYPYIDSNVGSILIEEFIRPLNLKLTQLEREQIDKERMEKLMLIQTSSRTDD